MVELVVHEDGWDGVEDGQVKHELRVVIVKHLVGVTLRRSSNFFGLNTPVIIPC